MSQADLFRKYYKSILKCKTLMESLFSAINKLQLMKLTQLNKQKERIKLTNPFLMIKSNVSATLALQVLKNTNHLPKRKRKFRTLKKKYLLETVEFALWTPSTASLLKTHIYLLTITKTLESSWKSKQRKEGKRRKKKTKVMLKLPLRRLLTMQRKKNRQR